MRDLQEELLARFGEARHKFGFTVYPLKVIAAVSGGIDSHALLHLLCSLAPDLGLEIIIAHVNHRLRTESEEEERFVRGLGERYQKDVVCFTADPKPAGANVEDWARTVRYQFFSRLREERNADLVLTAHHANDQAETMLMSVLSGRMAMRLHAVAEFDSERRIFRPLLNISRDEIAAYVAEWELSYVSDASNDNLQRTRNRIRHVLLPQLAIEYNPRIVGSLGQLAKRLAADEAELWSSAEKVAAGAGGEAVPVRFLLGLKPAICWRVLRIICLRQVGDRGKRLGYEAFLQVEEMLRQGTRRLDIGCGVAAFLDQNEEFHFLEEAAFSERFLNRGKSALRIPGEVTRRYVDGSMAVIRSRIIAVSEVCGENDRRAHFDFAALQGEPLAVRERREGDALNVARRGRRKLKKLLQEKKVLLTERDRIPVVECNGNIIWVPGVARAGLAPVTETTRQVLRLTCDFESGAEP